MGSNPTLTATHLRFPAFVGIVVAVVFDAGIGSIGAHVGSMAWGINPEIDDLAVVTGAGDVFGD